MLSACPRRPRHCWSSGADHTHSVTGLAIAGVAGLAGLPPRVSFVSVSTDTHHAAGLSSGCDILGEGGCYGSGMLAHKNVRVMAVGREDACPHSTAGLATMLTLDPIQPKQSDKIPVCCLTGV